MTFHLVIVAIAVVQASAQIFLPQQQVQQIQPQFPQGVQFFPQQIQQLGSSGFYPQGFENIREITLQGLPQFVANRLEDLPMSQMMQALQGTPATQGVVDMNKFRQSPHQANVDNIIASLKQTPGVQNAFASYNDQMVIGSGTSE